MIGSRTWIARTSGDLSGLDRLRLMSTIIRLRLKARWRPFATGTVPLIDFNVALPDSKLVKLAAEECRECCSPAVYHHSCRTFFWATAIGGIGAIRHDPEELAVASLLHDLELGKVQTRSQSGCNCFAGAGAATADRWLQIHQVEPDRRETIADAIALHLNPGVPLALGATAHLLNIGAMADVVGTRMNLVSKDQRQRVLDSYPRIDFMREMKGFMRAEKSAFPKTRAGFLMNIGFAKLIDDAPFEG